MKQQIQIKTGRVFKVYFEVLYKEPQAHENRTTACIVIAADATEAMAKAHIAFPGERVNSLYEDRHPHFGAPLLDSIVI